MRRCLARLVGLVFVAVVPAAQPGTAAAQGVLVPQLHSVTGVAATDRLNIRSGPGLGFAVIGSLAPTASGIEVTATNPEGAWGRINHGEGAGWVALRFMAPLGVHIDNFNMPVGMRCFGTEPFWSLTHDFGVLTLTEPGAEAARTFDIEIAQDTGIAEDFRRMIRARGAGGALTAYVHPGTCSDGMSDMLYRLHIGLMAGDGGVPLLTGCCSLAH